VNAYCGSKTRQRKLPLVIHIEPRNLMTLNKTCRYCPGCDLLIAHQDEIEAFLAAFFAQQKPEVVGNDYLILGTVDRADWKRGAQEPVAPHEMLEHAYIFKDVIQFTPVGGWR
jgi:hypothetical protein